MRQTSYDETAKAIIELREGAMAASSAATEAYKKKQSR
jgi:hypothetical protein